MRIKDIMTNQIAYVNPDTTVVETAQLMQKHDVGIIPVCQGTDVIGVVTDRDIVVRNIAHGKDPQATPVRDVMTTNVVAVNPDMNLHQAAEIMSNSQIRRLPVVDNNRLVGMVSLGDFATEAKQDMELAKTLGEISEPSRPERMSEKSDQ